MNSTAPGPLSLALCGCGGMGRRHIRGLNKLQSVNRLPFTLAAVCDPFAANALQAADLAEEILGHRPRIFSSLTEALGSGERLDAIDLTTSPDYHLPVGAEALNAGLHVLAEKPITLTVREGRQLIKAADEAGRVLAVAENYRRDPMNRLARALLDAGTIGTPFLAIQSSSGSGENVIITPWRHLKRGGGIMVDMGVHYTDLLEYYLGPIETVMGINAVVDKQRKDAQGRLHPADAEDLSVGFARFQSGALANWTLSLAGRGDGHFQRVIYGTGGSLVISSDRTGKPVRLTQRRNGQDTPVAEADLLTLVPSYVLDETTAALFGADRLTSYTMEFPDIDANLLAIEQADFAQAIISGRPPEVSGRDGLRSLALIYGFLEAERVGGPVHIDELLSGAVSSYQEECEPLT